MPPKDALYDLPAPVELMLDDEDSSSSQLPDTTTVTPLPVVGGGGEPAKDTATTRTVPPRLRHCRVSFATEEQNQVYDIDTNYTVEQKEQLWYTNAEFLAMVQDAGYKIATHLPSPPAAVPPRRIRSSQPVQTSWWIKSLWVGTVFMGLLATATALTSDSSSKRAGR